MMRLITAIALAAVVSTGNAGATGKTKKEVRTGNTALSIVDKDATPETKALYANLWLIQSRGVMFGHHDYPSYGVGWSGDEDRSDVKDIVGVHPAVYSLDMEWIDDRKVEFIKNAHRRGGVSMLVWHQTNPLTEGPGTEYPVGTAWDNTKVVDQILTEGSEMNVKYKKRLDGVAEWFFKMRDDEGKLIPVIFRPLHEHTQIWNWWGRKATTKREFIAFWMTATRASCSLRYFLASGVARISVLAVATLAALSDSLRARRGLMPDFIKPALPEFEIGFGQIVAGFDNEIPPVPYRKCF